MTHSHSWEKVSLGIGRWLLPWIAVVIASAILAYMVNSTFEQSTTSPSVVSAQPASVIPEGCAPIGAGYVDSSIVAESRRIACGHGAP